MFENEPFVKANDYSAFNDELEVMDVDFLELSDDEEEQSYFQQLLDKGVKKGLKGPISNPALIRRLQAKKNRVNNLRKMLRKLSAEVKVTPAQMSGLLMHLEADKENESSGEIGLRIFMGQKNFDI